MVFASNFISRNPIYPQENVVLVNSSSISTENDELEFLEGNTKEIILAKDINGNFFAEGFQPPLPQRPGSRPTTGIGGSNGSSAPSSGNLDGSCSTNPTLKAAAEVGNYVLGSPPKTKKQKALEKMKRELKESIEEEDKLNADRKKQGKGNITLMIKDGIRLFAPNEQLRDKLHHAPNLDSPIPEILGYAELSRLSNPNLYKERLEIFRNEDILPDLRLHVFNPDTKMIEGTFAGQRDDIDLNGNIM